MKRLPFCKGNLIESRIEHVHRWKSQLYILRNVPAEECSQCGEVFFEPATLKAMDEVVTQTKPYAGGPPPGARVFALGGRSR
jgi:YgiT-type zinc finger domain-containing protein